MEFDANVEHLRLAFWQIILTAGPILGTALAVGLTIGILQAATSINEMTLSFVPKLVLVLLALALFSPFIICRIHVVQFVKWPRRKTCVMFEVSQRENIQQRCSAIVSLLTTLLLIDMVKTLVSMI